jgi:hypothetical protein
MTGSICGVCTESRERSGFLPHKIAHTHHAIYILKDFHFQAIYANKFINSREQTSIEHKYLKKLGWRLKAYKFDLLKTHRKILVKQKNKTEGILSVKIQGS